MQGANLLEFGSGGGFIGDGKDVIFQDVKFAEHSFEKKDKASGAVLETYEPGCMLVTKFEIEDPDDDNSRFGDQILPVGNLPGSRLDELGFNWRRDRPGGAAGYRPSADNENPAEEGGFLVLDGAKDIWAKSAYAQFMDEIIGLAKGAGVVEKLANLIASEGVSGLAGLRCKLGMKALPKSKAKAADPTSKDKHILVPTEINAWPWEAKKSAGKGTAAKPAAAKAAPKAAAKASAPAAAESTSGNGNDYEAIAIERVQQAITEAGGTLARKALVQNVFRLTAKDGGPDVRSAIAKVVNSEEFLNAQSGSSWLYDGESLIGIE